jgi:CubicO group peptidase (beta-lactamase class C family)
MPWAQSAPAMRLARIDSIVRSTQRAIGAPGVSVAVARNGRVVYSRAFGLADVENTVAATAATEYRIASVSKPITATAVLRLVQDGKLALDSSVRRYVPELGPAFERVTLRDLLRHTSGVRHYRDNAEFVTTRHCDSLQQALAIFANDPLEHAPGEKITYSSWGYVLLGLAIERASGMSYPTYVQRMIFDRADMRSTRLDNLDLIPHRAHGYRRSKPGQLINAPPVDVSCRLPAGGFVSTTEDLLRFVTALDHGRLIDPAASREMMRSQITSGMISRTLAGMQVPAGFQPPGMGFGWAVEPDGDAAYHGGNQPGFTSMLYHIPAQHLSVVVMVNLDGLGDELTTLARDIAKDFAALR